MGDAVVFEGTDSTFPSGNRLVHGEQGVVTGPSTSGSFTSAASTTSAHREYPLPKAWESAIGLRVELPFVSIGTGKAAREYNEGVASQARDDSPRLGSITSVAVKFPSNDGNMSCLNSK